MEQLKEVMKTIDTTTEKKICKQMLDLSSMLVTQHMRVWDVILQET